MKFNYLLFILILGLLGCNSEIKKENEKLREQITQLKQENESYLAQTEKQATSIESYKKLLNEINQNLNAIGQNTTMVGKLGNDSKEDPNVRELVLTRIDAIKTLMENSRVKIRSLDKSLRELRQKYGEQSEEVLKLSNEIELKSKALLEKELELAEMTENFDDLELAYEQQVQLAIELGEILNRAFYYSGTGKELVQKGIVDKKGGFIGLWQTKVLNANSDQQLFTQIKKDQTDTLVFAGKSIKLISQHDTSGYKKVESGDECQLIIVDKKAFWKTSNYLVVEVK